MLINTDRRFLIVGLGLIGGSYAMKLKRVGFHVSAITKEQSSVDFALKNGIIDEGTTQIDKDMIGKADMIIFGLYPHTFIEWIAENQKYIKKGARITDVTGVKGCIVDKIQNMLRDDLEFIPAHPMAGREVSGVENSTDAIFKDANYIVTPTEKNSEAAIEECMQLGKILGFKRISKLTPDEHDNMIGYVSQLTHCIAVSLMTCCDNEGIENFTGDSFRDLTRIAKINDVMWSELFLANKSALLRQMNQFLSQFERLKSTLENEDIVQMRKIMQASTARRKIFDKE